MILYGSRGSRIHSCAGDGRDTGIERRHRRICRGRWLARNNNTEMGGNHDYSGGGLNVRDDR